MNLSGWSLVELAKGCRKLKTLILFNCHSVIDFHLSQMFTFCTQLTCLDIRNCQLFSGRCLEMGVTAALRRLYIRAKLYALPVLVMHTIQISNSGIKNNWVV